MKRSLAAALLALGACKSAPAPTVCNGHAELCARAYDAIAYPGTHDAYSNVAKGFVAADQTYTLARQLQDGIRVLHLEIVPNGGDPYLCHSICGLGNEALVDGLGEIASFVSTSPNEVVTLLMESRGITTDQIASAFDAAKLRDFTHGHVLGEPWPTLGAMLARGERVVVFHADFTSSGGATYDFMLDRFAWTWETPWDNQVPADFGRCDADRGTKGNDLYVVDTYLEDLAIQTADHAALVNDDPFLVDRLLHCKSAEGVMPNFVMVNYYEVGEVFQTVDVLNGFVETPDADLSGFPPATFSAPDAATD